MSDDKKGLLLATADLGKANGMRAGAEILRALAKGRRTINTTELLEAAVSLNEAARKIDVRTHTYMEALRK